ncbi:hypothetical protein A3A59_04040 [Candidatus Gottesmanbacteria bacterium RIFCSPLOWO2_01_FULL_42_10]|nr:MAG: hypothetical protein A3A59_04040 [Candidatus Gottesmanbacteria bacterium RIFCSPLOWO2_01_FULL_42_10]
MMIHEFFEFAVFDFGEFNRHWPKLADFPFPPLFEITCRPGFWDNCLYSNRTFSQSDFRV